MGKIDLQEKYKHLIGRKFNKLTIVAIVRGEYNTKAKCECECKNISYPALVDVVRGKTKSCGCCNRRIGETLCWRCKHAVPNHRGDGRTKNGNPAVGCEWSIFFKPVPGWTAKESERIEKKAKYTYVSKSYCISRCPKFEEG